MMLRMNNRMLEASARMRSPTKPWVMENVGPR